MDKDLRFERIYRRNYGFVYRLFRTCRVSDDESHDLAQDTFKRLYERLDQYRGDDDHIRSYLKTMAMRVLYNWVRAREVQKRKVELVYIDDPDFNAEPPAPEPKPLEQLQEEERRNELLREAMLGLSDSKKRCLILWLEGHSYDQIANIMKTTLDAVRSCLRDARKHLARAIGRAR